MFLISLIFIFLTPQSNYAEVLKMLKIFGKVPTSDLSKAQTDENCTQTCFSDSDCVLAFFNINSQCLLFFYNSTETLEVQETNRDDGLFVAFKVIFWDFSEILKSDFQTNLSTTNPDFCPIESEIDPTILLGEDPIPWTKTSDSTWQFRKCIGNWKMFERTDPNITVCIQVFLTGFGTTQTEAKDYCSSMGKQVTGVAMVEESKWILKQTKEKFGRTLPIWQGVWIDGERETIGENNFTWTDGYTVGYKALENGWAKLTETEKGQRQDCLVVSITDKSGIINDVDCGYGGGIQQGVACGYKLE
ncbi:hypothetical protein B9Z55_027119 [Caenorhabditis nigoni]|nr:hypothetical protein B9Z55_027119 [Caenorhabditis nigoni]